MTIPRTHDERRFFLRYARTEQWPILQRFPVPAAVHGDLLAGMMDCTPEQAAALVDELDAARRSTAAAMLADPGYRAAVETLAIRGTDRIVAIGDSITSDRIGWAELLITSLDLAGPAPGRMHNLGVSGNTTADALERFDLLEAVRPTTVLVMLGTNDARAHGRGAGHPMATARETERNLRALTAMVSTDLGASVRLVTPPAVDEDRVGTYFDGQPLRWHADAIAEIAAVIRRVDPACVDAYELIRAGGPDLLEADGVHPTAAGQQRLARAIAACLAS